MGIYGFYLGDNYKDVIDKCLKQGMECNAYFDYKYYKYDKQYNKFIKFDQIPNASATLGLTFNSLPGINIDAYENFARIPKRNNEIMINFIEAKDDRATFQMYFLVCKKQNINNLAFSIVVWAKEDVAHAIAETLSKRYTQINVPKRADNDMNKYLGWQANNLYAVMVDNIAAPATLFNFFSPDLVNVIIKYNMDTEQAQETKRKDAIYDGI